MDTKRFSERYGYTTVDDTLQIGDMNEVLKTVIGSYLYKRYQQFDNINTPSKKFMEYLFMQYLKWHVNQIADRATLRLEHFSRIYNNLEWYEIYDFIEIFYSYYSNIGYFKESQVYTNGINNILKREHSGYRLIDGKITPITDENEISSIKEAIEENLLDTAKAHIQEALQKLSNREHPDYRNSIKESISAVEAICRHITGESTLDKALAKLKNKGIIIPDMLKAGMEKMYYFTNGKEGIRHALMEDDVSIKFEEAKYMLVTCSAFVNYMITKLAKVQNNDK